MAKRPKAKAEESGRMRLNRFLARAGVASRRRCDELIAAGSVRVNGKVPGPGDSVDGDSDRVTVNGKQVNLPQKCEYILMNKRRDTLVTRSDQRGRTTIYEDVPSLRPATVAVGRLDRDTTGVLLLTDDGELAFRLTHPKYGVDKRYIAVVEGFPSEGALTKLAQGVELEDGPTAPADITLLPTQDRRRARIEMVLHEGRKHQVKRMCLAVGHRVRSLRRASFAGLQVGDLRPGQHRQLRPEEIRRLLKQVGLDR
jgi:23S rRNA pseudouridine2605 synthase